MGKEVNTENTLKSCNSCGFIKPISSFGKNKKNKDGRKDYCVLCYKAKKAGIIGSKFDKRESKLTAKERSIRLKIKDPVEWKSRDIRKKLVSRCNTKQEKSKVPNKKDIRNWLENKLPLTCFYSGEYVDIFEFEIDHKNPVSRGGSNNLQNLAISTSSMNRAKGEMNEKEFFQLLETISVWEDQGKSLLSRLKRGFY